jgi:hypothetical protein
LNEKKGETSQRYPYPKDESCQVPLKKESREKDTEAAADDQKDKAGNQRELGHSLN